MFLFLDSCCPLLTHALAWPRLTNHSLPPKWRWFVHNIISPGLPPVKKIASDKHVFAKLPLVTLFISNLTRLTAVVCMKVRFEAKVTRGFSLSPRRFRDSLSPLRGLLFREEKSRKTSGTRVRKNGKTLRCFVQKALRLTLCKSSPKEISPTTKTEFNRLYNTYFICQISFFPWATIVKWWNHLVTWFAAAVVGCRRAQSDKW